MPKSTSDKTLLAIRDKKIKATFNLLFNKKRLRIDDVMFKLKWEYFFVSEHTLKRVLREQDVKLPITSNKPKPHPEGLTLTEARDKAFAIRFNHLFNTKRLRLDDVIETLSTKEYFLRKETVEKYINKFN